MNWFENKTTQLIALVGIVGTLAGFGYQGATYVNRIENLEAQIGGIGDTELKQKAIEERFAGIEKSVEYLEKQINNISVPDVTEIKTDIATIKADVQSLDKALDKLETKAASLEQFPERGRLLPELIDSGITQYRELISAPWRIIYRIEQQEVFVTAVLDSRRDLQTLLLRRFGN